MHRQRIDAVSLCTLGSWLRGAALAQMDIIELLSLLRRGLGELDERTIPVDWIEER
ncbi:MAG: hypothetical protein GXP55_23125 [Deltaproteobacteria bacterium]|nr:hypothetical protein [Deltaproteobacteria bacterium]